MSGDRLQLRLWRRGERLALPPRVVDGRQEPAVALRIPHDPLLVRPLDKEGHPTLWSTRHGILLWSMVVSSTGSLDLTLSPIVPGRSAACGAAAKAGVPVPPPSRPWKRSRGTLKARLATVGRKADRAHIAVGASVSTAHRITSSARLSRAGGIVMPRAWAVLRLMTKSNVVSCATGRSAGWAPLRI